LAKQFYKGDFETSRAYSKVVATSGGRTLWLAGVGAPFDEHHNSLAGNFEAQTHASFAKLKANLELAGGQLSDIVTMTVFITDCRYGTDFVNIRREYFPDGNFPASALIGIEALAKQEMMVEIQAIAVVDDLK
jgi:2-iminobutanoate/2-iminopropanoate deaminase